MEEKKIGILSIISVAACVLAMIMAFVVSIGLPMMIPALVAIAAIIVGIVALVRKEKIAMPIVGISVAVFAIIIAAVCSLTRSVVKTAGGIAGTTLNRFNDYVTNYDYNSLYNYANSYNYNIVSNGTSTNYTAFNTTTNTTNTTNTTTNTTTVERSDTQTVGTASDGYVKVPNNWNRFYDPDAPSTFQYSYANVYIVTLMGLGSSTQTIDTLADSMKARLSQEGATNIDVLDASVGGYSAKKVRGYYTSDNVWIDIYFIKANNNIYYVSLEGPDKTSEYFKIPDTFTLYN